ncbi:MAG TPA: ribose 5-phosphate isomerase B [Alloacidobacterium sp.]|jgi:ribose 5-phosphate isomerase B|nr:ribose 5-phosphate isomerase B [Alloacidobacterium sp.]
MTQEKCKIAVGSDHAAFSFKEEIKNYLSGKGYEVRDFGTCNTERVDYCDFGFAVGEAVARGEFERGIVCCGSGIGISISANKVPGIRAVVCSEPYSARLSRLHNDTNVLALGARVVGIELAKMIVDEWVQTPFEGGRHAQRVEKIRQYELHKAAGDVQQIRPRATCEGKLSIGVDLGGTNIKFGLVDASGKVLLSSKEKTPAGQGDAAIVDSILFGVRRLLNESGAALRSVESLGIGVPGTVEPKTGVILFAPNLHLANFNIIAPIHKAFDIPVCVTQDTRAAAWGEYLVGSGQGVSTVASITLGTGVGCGMVLNGSIFHGGLNTAGEFGHMIVESDGRPCNCGRCGCLEAYAGGSAILRDARSVIKDLPQRLKKDEECISVEDVFELAVHGDVEARQITDQAVRYLGIGIVNLVNLNSIEIVSISGGISNAPDTLLLNPLREFVRNRAYKLTSEKVHLCKSSLGEDAPLIGAALLYCEESYRTALLA